VIPLDAGLVKGSHGRPPASPKQGPLLITRQRELLPEPSIAPIDVCDLVLRHLTLVATSDSASAGTR
jgi:hypothetical protein